MRQRDGDRETGEKRDRETWKRGTVVKGREEQKDRGTYWMRDRGPEGPGVKGTEA
jgi:hypothetical protein